MHPQNPEEASELKVKSQAVVRHLVLVLGTELSSSGRAISALNRWAVSPASFFAHFQTGFKFPWFDFFLFAFVLLVPKVRICCLTQAHSIYSHAFCYCLTLGVWPILYMIWSQHPASLFCMLNCLLKTSPSPLHKLTTVSVSWPCPGFPLRAQICPISCAVLVIVTKF